MSSLIALALPHAWAFAPNALDGTSLEPQRVQVQHPSVQARYLRSEAWEAFRRTDGVGWSARFDEHTGTPRVLWGRGIPMPADEAALTEALADLLERHRALLGLGDGHLALRSASFNARMGMWYVDFDVLRGGLATYRGGISARVKHGNLILLHVATAPDAPVTGQHAITQPRAISAAIAQGPAPGAEHTDRSAKPVLLDRKAIDGHELRRTWMVRTRTADPPGIWVSFVDAETGALLNVHNEVRFVSGTVEGEHHARTVDGSPLVTSPMPFVEVSSGADADITDLDGNYTVNAGNTYSTDLSGAYLQVFNAAGAEGFLSSSNPDLVWDSGDATQAEISTYVFVHQVKEWGERHAPEVPMVSQDLVAQVNLNDNCNAYWDGNINFFRSGSGCNNTGEIADVVYHEWGHGFHYFSIEAGYFDGSLSEGAGDTVSFLQTGDHLMAPYFGTSGWAIRDLAPDQVYPNDYVNSANYVHSNGLIFGGAMWDLHGALQNLEGAQRGTEITSDLFAGILKGGTDIPGTFYEALAADDDDGNLDNGTPHTCQIHDAFARHGLGPGSGGDTIVIPSHEPLVFAPAGRDHAIDLELIEVQAGCAEGRAVRADVHWRVDGGVWQTTALDTSSAMVSGAIPAQPAGSIVEYYLTGVSDDGDDFAAPVGQWIHPYTFFVGEVLQIACSDFEADDGGFTHELVAGVEQEGADDWQWGPPNGRSGDPARAFSGDNVWGNDLGFENFNGAYQPDKVNRLTSPEIETGHYTGVFLQYRRWLQVEDATYDQASITANGQTVWSNWQGASGADHHQDGEWASHVVDLQGLGDRGAVRLAWELQSDAGLEMGGWTLDDVCIVAPATPDNRLGIVDLALVAEADTQVGLSWTNPVHDPVERVVVTRRFDRLPTAWDDGDLVFDDADPALGARVAFSDLNFHPGDSFYAVYGFDGSAWLSWTIEGWNAGSVAIEGGEPPPGWPTDADGDGVIDDVEGLGDRGVGCGCAGTGSSAVGWIAALGAMISLRRRRA